MGSIVLWLFDRVDLRTVFAAVAGTVARVVLASGFVYRRPPGHSKAVSESEMDYLEDPYEPLEVAGHE